MTRQELETKLASGDRNFERASLAGADLAGATLAGATLRGGRTSGGRR